MLLFFIKIDHFFKSGKDQRSWDFLINFKDTDKFELWYKVCFTTFFDLFSLWCCLFQQSLLLSLILFCLCLYVCKMVHYVCVFFEFYSSTYWSICCTYDLTECFSLVFVCFSYCFILVLFEMVLIILLSPRISYWTIVVLFRWYLCWEIFLMLWYDR